MVVSQSSKPNAIPIAPTEAPFYIPATNSPSRPRRTLKHDDTFAVFDSYGDIGASAGGPDGLFDHDTRYLSHLELLINGTQPLLLHSEIKADNLSFSVDLTNPDIYRDGKLWLPKDTVHIARAIYLYNGSLRERMCFTNHGSDEINMTLSLAFASDFADIFEVRGIRRERRGESWAQLTSKSSVLLSYRGLDAVVRETSLSFEPPPSLLQSGIASYGLSLAPGSKRAIFLTVAGREQLPRSTLSFFTGLLRLNRERRIATGGAASVETSNSLLNEVLYRSRADLHMLMTATPQGHYPYAGIPWYSTTFGRDGIIAAMHMLWLDPNIAAGVLRRLADLQAIEVDSRADAEPGKIVHEMRGGEMAALGEVPFGKYYGSVDATPLFVMLAGAYLQRTGDTALISQLWPAIERALAWIDGPADVDGDGFIEYARGVETGLANQGWRIRTTRSSMPTACWPAAPSPWWKCRAMCMPPRRGRRRAHAGLASRHGRPNSSGKRKPCVDASKRASGAKRSAATRWRSTVPSPCAKYVPAMPAMRSLRASPGRNARKKLPPGFCCFPTIRVGASAPSRTARRATIPCPITTDRSGRTIMR